MTDELRRVRNWDLPRGRWVELPHGGRVFVREVPGNPARPTIVLLHGIATTGGLMWFATMSQLNESFRVLAPDVRGHGRSSCDGPLRLADAADDVISMLDTMKVEQPILFGYSLGGLVAQLAAHRHPGRLTGLVLSATASTIGPRGVRRAPMRAAGRVSHALAGLPRQKTWFRPLADETDFLGGSWGWFRAEMRGCNPVTMMEALHEVERFNSKPWAAEIDVPAAFVVTRRDRVVPWYSQEALARRVNARIFSADAGHTAPGTAPDAWGPAALEACQWVAAAPEASSDLLDGTASVP